MDCIRKPVKKMKLKSMKPLKKTIIVSVKKKKKKKKNLAFARLFCRAEDEARTRDNQLGRLELYQLSYFRIRKALTFVGANIL